MSNLQSVLIVDDEANIRNGIKYIMNWKEEGYLLIDEAENGLDALEKIEIHQPDIVITDLKMPKMDGIELTQIIKENYPEIDFFILSSYDDFQSVSQSFKNGAIDYILKPTLTKEILLENLNKVRLANDSRNKPISQSIILQESLNRFLSGYDKNNLSQFSDYLKSDNYLIVYSNLNYIKNSDVLSSNLKKIEEASFTQKSIKFLTNHTDTGLLIGISSEINIKKEFNNLFQAERNTQNEFHFIVSQKIKNIDEVYSIFNFFSTKSSEQIFFFKTTPLIFQDKFLKLDDIDAFEISDFLKELLDKNFLLSLSRIETYFNHLILSTASPHAMKQQASSIFYSLISRIEEEYPNEEELYKIKINFIQTVNKLSYLEDFSEFVLTNISKIRLIISKHLNEDDSTLTLIKQYINENYQKNLSLTDLADKFHFNYNYLSVFLSANLDMSFPDYLKKIRMDEAKKLLVNSDMSLSEISASVGYSDLSYFSKIFKKEFNITPSKYRRTQKP